MYIYKKTLYNKFRTDIIKNIFQCCIALPLVLIKKECRSVTLSVSFTSEKIVRTA